MVERDHQEAGVKVMVEGEEEEERELIPGEVCALEILPHLPGKDLLQQMNTKPVCKDWATLIGTPYFARLHLSRASSNVYQTTPRIRVLKPVHSCRYFLKEPQELDVGIHEYDNYCSEEEKDKIIPYPPVISQFHTIIVGSVDGLICLLDMDYRLLMEQYKFTICNPSTRRFFSVRLPCLLQILRCWFGGGIAAAGEYVLVLLQGISGLNFEFVVYKFTGSSSNSSLKRIRSTLAHLHNPNGYLVTGDVYRRDRGILVHGAIYWLIQWANADIIAQTNHQYLHRYTIISYHLQSNTCVHFSPPVQYCDFRLGAMDDGCLCATLKKWGDSSVFELWVRKESRWTKHANIEGFNNFRVLSPLGFFPNTIGGDFLVGADDQLIKYNFHHNQAVLLKDYVCPGNQAIMCADTLVSPSICRSGLIS
ncbi:hypothetical protein OROMI_009735 [Orobanche minor]